MNLSSSFGFCRHSCGNCSISLHEEFRPPGFSNVTLNKSLLANINSIEFLVILYQLYRVKVGRPRFDDVSISCSKVILVNSTSTGLYTFEKELVFHFIEEWNGVCPSDTIAMSDGYKQTLKERLANKNNAEFLSAFRCFVLEQLSVSEPIFDYICSQWKCEIVVK